MSSSNIFLDKLLIIKSTGLLSFESSTVCSKKSEVAGFIGYPLSWKKDIVFNSSWNFLYLTVVSFHMKEIELAIKSANCTPKLILESTIERELMGKGKRCFRVSYPTSCCFSFIFDNCSIISKLDFIGLESSVITFIFIFNFLYQ